MNKGFLLASAGVAVSAGAAVFAGRRREAATLANLLDRLGKDGLRLRRIEPGLVDEVSIDGLPEPVKRYFRHVLAQGQPLIRSVTLRQSGWLRTDIRAARWFPFTADHLVVPPAKGFVWNAKVGTPLATHVRVLDSYISGSGAGRVSLLSAFPIASEANVPELNAGELHRYLAEAVWYPTALLPQAGVGWTPIDSHAATATLAAGGTTVSLEFRFNEIGEVTGIYSAGRFGRFAGAYRQIPWEGHFRGYRPIVGMRVPSYGEVGWYEDDELREEPGEPMRGELRLVWKSDIVDFRYEFDQDLPI